MLFRPTSTNQKPRIGTFRGAKGRVVGRIDAKKLPKIERKIESVPLRPAASTVSFNGPSRRLTRSGLALSRARHALARGAGLGCGVEKKSEAETFPRRFLPAGPRRRRAAQHPASVRTRPSRDWLLRGSVKRTNERALPVRTWQRRSPSRPWRACQSHRGRRRDTSEASMTINAGRPRAWDGLAVRSRALASRRSRVGQTPAPPPPPPPPGRPSRRTRLATTERTGRRWMGRLSRRGSSTSPATPTRCARGWMRCRPRRSRTSSSISAWPSRGRRTRSWNDSWSVTP